MEAVITSHGAQEFAKRVLGMTNSVDDLWLLLLRSAPLVGNNDASALDEPTDIVYARQQLSLGDANWEAPYQYSGRTQYLNNINYAVATEDWGTLIGWGLADSQTNGLLYLWAEFSEPMYLEEGQQFVVTAGELAIQLYGEAS